MLCYLVLLFTLHYVLNIYSYVHPGFLDRDGSRLASSRVRVLCALFVADTVTALYCVFTRKSLRHPVPEEEGGGGLSQDDDGLLNPDGRRLHFCCQTRIPSHPPTHPAMYLCAGLYIPLSGKFLRGNFILFIFEN